MAHFTFHHRGVSVPSLEDAIEWYDRILGFKLERRFHITAARSHTAMMRKGSLRFELFEVEGAAPLPEDRRNPAADIKTHGNKHLAFRIADLEAFLAEMAEQQAEVALVVRENFGKGCFIRDPAGNLIEFVEEADD
ncbi:VOC family protein [Novosphingobium sp. B1]|uniref:VOC family protein n=1 Tax=Novosphingobium sp. B1 TaxID=1938756 RepID=UPI0009D7A335|nr:VOC family protein [Novosphingobium sp. B1]SMC36999.1 methylmalonyl-CoA/ethylmalonyl-CoA epimerase [Novosphingobium sp. B1]